MPAQFVNSFSGRDTTHVDSIRFSPAFRARRSPTRVPCWADQRTDYIGLWSNRGPRAFAFGEFESNAPSSSSPSRGRAHAGQTRGRLESFRGPNGEPAAFTTSAARRVSHRGRPSAARATRPACRANRARLLCLRAHPWLSISGAQASRHAYPSRRQAKEERRSFEQEHRAVERERSLAGRDEAAQGSSPVSAAHGFGAEGKPIAEFACSGYGNTRQSVSAKRHDQGAVC